MSPMPIQTKIGEASLKFGPDWLRALSSSDSGSTGGPAGSGPGGWSSGSGGGGGVIRDGGSYSSAASSSQHQQFSSSNAPPHREGRLGSASSTGFSNNSNSTTNRFQQAEFAYGREEMLALFDKNLPPPDFLPAFGTLFIEKMQPPLAFSQPCEDELRVWHVPQPESSRQSNSAPPPVGRGAFSIRGRGVGSERGRGRGRGSYYVRPHEEEDRGSFSRPRTFERSQSAHERVWAERNGAVGQGPSPPEDGGARGGSWRTRESYSNKRYDNEEEGWRKPRWRRGEDEDDTAYRSNSRRLHKSWSDDGTQDNLPEWAKDNPSEESGTFDASGAFHEEDRYSAKSSAFEQNRRELERNNRDTKGESEPYGSQNDRVQKRAHERNDVKTVIPSLEEEPEDTSLELDRPQNSKQQQSHNRSIESKPGAKTSVRNDEASMSQGMHVHEMSPSVMPKEHLTQQQKSSQPDSESISRQSLNQPQARIQQPTNETRSTNASRNLNSLQEEHYYSMTEEADMVAKLIEDDGSIVAHSSHSHSSSIPSGSSGIPGSIAAGNQLSKMVMGSMNLGGSNLPMASQQAHGRPPSPSSFEVWFYRDPQGNVQGPFATHEMAQWYSQGYFTGGLLLRRECDKGFITLSEMGKMYGRNPFLVIPDSPPPPPLHDPSPSALDNIPDPNIQAQYHQRQLIQQNILREQQYLMKVGQGVSRKEDDAWQGQIQHPHNPQFAQSQSSGAVGLSQAQIQAQMILNIAKQAGVGVMGKGDGPPKNEFMNTMMQPQMSSQRDAHKSPTHDSSDPIQSLVQQLTSMVPQQQKSSKQMDTPPHWASSNAPVVSTQQIAGWPSQSQPPANNHMWDYSEQFMNMQQQKLEGEMFRQKKEEEKERKRLEEEERKRKEEQQRFEAEELEKNRKLMEEQYMQQKKQEDALLLKQQQAAELARQKELLLQQQRLHQQELERQQQRFEQQRLEQQRMEQQRVEQQRIEQQMRQEHQEREEQRRMQLELEEQQRRVQQENEEKQRQQQLRVQEQEAAKQQEMQEKFSWMTNQLQQHQAVENAPPPMSLLEIQQEEAMKEHENALRQQAAKKTKLMQQEQARLQREAKSGMSLKWAQPPQKVVAKSFAEIQAEEQAKLAKQQEKDREQRQIVNQHSQLQQAWSSSLTWANRASLNAPPTTSPKLNGGIWDDSPALGPTASSVVKQGRPAATGTTNSSPPVSAGGNSNKPSTQTQAKRPKESDEQFMKLFHEHGMKQATRTQSQHHPQDEFTRWCYEVVEGIGGGGIDIATFISFLKEVDSPFEVTDYVRSYLGDGKEARQFGNEFLERRSRWKNARKDQEKDGGSFEDNLCRPAYAVNPTQSSEFQEVKVKGKKGKKGRMQKVDARILGFNTTSAPDRVNVGKRDYGDGTE